MNRHSLGKSQRQQPRTLIQYVFRFLRNEIWAADKLPGNINILTGLTLFFGGIAAVRTWGELMIPA